MIIDSEHNELQKAVNFIHTAKLKQAQSILQDWYRKTESQDDHLHQVSHAQVILLLGYWHIVVGEYTAAEPLLQQAAKDTQYHDIAKIMLSKLYRKCGQYQKAWDLLEQLSKRLPEDSEKQAATQDEMGCVLLHLEKFDAATEHFERAAKWYEQNHGMQYLESLRSFRHVAIMYHLQGYHQEALSILNSLLAIAENLYSDPHPETAKILSDLAHFYDYQGDTSLAAQLHQRALNITLQVFENKNHPTYARCLCRYAMHFIQHNTLSEALPLLNQAVSIYLRIFDENHPTVKNLLRFIVFMQLTSNNIFPDTDTLIQ